jgi:hypothetical protein
MLNADQPVASELRCAGCGYDLRGLPRNGRCPECGTPVVASLAQFTLYFADPGWLARLQLGTRLLLTAVVWFIGGIITNFALLASNATPNMTTASHAVFGVVAVALLCASSWCATTPSPAMRATVRGLPPYRLARLAILVVGAWAITMTVLNLTTAGWMWFAGGSVLASPVGLIAPLGVWAVTRHFETLTRQAGDRFFTERARSYRVGFITSWTVLAIGWPVSMALSAIRRLEMVAQAVGIGAGIGGVFVVIFGLLVLLFPLYLVPHLRRAREQALRIREPATRAVHS